MPKLLKYSDPIACNRTTTSLFLILLKRPNSYQLANGWTRTSNDFKNNLTQRRRRPKADLYLVQLQMGGPGQTTTTRTTGRSGEEGQKHTRSANWPAYLPVPACILPDQIDAGKEDLVVTTNHILVFHKEKGYDSAHYEVSASEGYEVVEMTTSAFAQPERSLTILLPSALKSAKNLPPSYWRLWTQKYRELSTSRVECTGPRITYQSTA